jgi:hypothetical protein
LVYFFIFRTFEFPNDSHNHFSGNSFIIEYDSGEGDEGIESRY